MSVKVNISSENILPDIKQIKLGVIKIQIV